MAVRVNKQTNVAGVPLCWAAFGLPCYRAPFLGVPIFSYHTSFKSFMVSLVEHLLPVYMHTVNQFWGSLRSRGFLTSEPRGAIENRRRTSSPCPPLENLEWPELALHLNYVAGYTNPLLFKQTQQSTPLTTRVQGQALAAPCLASPMFVRPHR